MDHRRLLADIFHDVDLTAVGPMDSIDIVAQHPECRPDALAKRNLNPRFETAIGLAELAPGEQSGRGVVTSSVVSASESFLDRLNDQRSILNVRVCCSARIGLELVIAPAVAAKIKRQLCRINRRSSRAIELVAPHESPPCRLAD